MVFKIGSGEIDDLSTLNVLDEESLLRELRARYKKGIIYVSYSVRVENETICFAYLSQRRLILATF